MNEHARRELENKAESGDPQAQIKLAQLLESDGQVDAAVEWLRKAIAGGNAHAKWLLAKRFLSQEPFHPDEGSALLFSADDEGDARAAHMVAVHYAIGIGVACDWSKAFEYLTRAAELGLPNARDELTLLATNSIKRDCESESAPKHWQHLRDAIDLPDWITAPPRKIISHDPRIMVVEGAASPAICDWLIGREKPLRATATVIDQATGEERESETRTNSATAFDLFKLDMIFAVFRLRTSALTGLPVGPEAVNILHYTIGQTYQPHYDFVHATSSDAAMLTHGRQRVVTFLLYLNDDYEGGETHFPKLSWQFKAKKGDALFFWNVDEQGRPHQETLHEGCAPTADEKWVLSQWIQR